MTIAKQLTLVLAKEIIADKRNRHVTPDYAMLTEIHKMIGVALDALVADGALIRREVSVNRNPAYVIPETQSQPAL